MPDGGQRGAEGRSRDMALEWVSGQGWVGVGVFSVRVIRNSTMLTRELGNHDTGYGSILGLRR